MIQSPQRIALYARVSSDEQRDQHTIQTQLEYARGRAKLERWELVEFIDDGISGKKYALARRPAGAKLLEAARHGDFAKVITYRLDRLGRNVRYIFDAIEELRKLGVEYQSLTEPFDTSTPAGKLFLGVLAVFAEFESDSIAQRMRDGKVRVAKYDDRRLTGVVPYGYSRGEEHRLVIDPGEAGVVRQIYAWATAGWSHGRIAKELNMRAIPPHANAPGKRKTVKLDRWERPAISRILSSPIYVGRASFFKTSKHEEVAYRTVPAIVDATTFQAARAATKANLAFGRAHNKHDYLLRGLVKCGTCTVSINRRMNSPLREPATIAGRQWRDRHGYYCHRCPRGEKAFIEESGLLELLWRDVLDFLGNPDETLRALARTASEAGSNEDRAERDLLALAEKLREFDFKESQLVDMRMNKTITPAIYDEKFRAITAEREHLRLEMQAVREARAAAARATEESEAVRQLLGNLRKVAERVGSDERARAEIIRIVTKAVMVVVTDKKPRLHVTYAFGRPASRVATESTLATTSPGYTPDGVATESTLRSTCQPRSGRRRACADR